jgi:hypothetical protein
MFVMSDRRIHEPELARKSGGATVLVKYDLLAGDQGSQKPCIATYFHISSFPRTLTAHVAQTLSPSQLRKAQQLSLCLRFIDSAYSQSSLQYS